MALTIVTKDMKVEDHLIHKDGSQEYTSNQPMGGNKLTGVGLGSSSTDSINKSQLDLKSDIHTHPYASDSHNHAHNSLSSINGGISNQYYHLTADQHANITDGGYTTYHKHEVIRMQKRNQYVSSWLLSGGNIIPYVNDVHYSSPYNHIWTYNLSDFGRPNSTAKPIVSVMVERDTDDGTRDGSSGDLIQCWINSVYVIHSEGNLTSSDNTNTTLVFARDIGSQLKWEIKIDPDDTIDARFSYKLDHLGWWW